MLFRSDQPDIWAFRRFNWADSPVMGMMDVADVETGAFAADTAGTERRERTLMAELRQRVGLVHELGQLRRAEKLAHGGDDRTDIDEADRGDAFLVANRHAFFDNAFHAAQPDPQLVAD